MSLADLQPEGCPYPVDEQATAVSIPRCLGGCVALECELCPSEDQICSPSVILDACSGRWVMIDVSTAKITSNAYNKDKRYIDREECRRIIAAADSLRELRTVGRGLAKKYLIRSVSEQSFLKKVPTSGKVR